MAYGVKYRFQWADDAGATWKVDISKDGYSGSVLMRSVGGSSAVLRRDRSGNICGTSLELAAECVVDEEFAELYTTDPYEFKVEVFCGSTSMWVGFVTPELYSEPFIAPPYDVEVTASDNLGELKRFKWGAVGRQSIATLLSTLLYPTGLSLNQRYISRLSTSSLVASEFFSNVTLDLDELAGETYYDVLDNLLSTFHAVIFQQGGCWCILRETDVTSSITGNNVVPIGVSTGYPIESIGSAYAGGLWPEGHVDLTVEPAHNGVSLICQELWGRYGTATVNNSSTQGVASTMTLVANFSASDNISLQSGNRYPICVNLDFAKLGAYASTSQGKSVVEVKATGSGVVRYLVKSDDGYAWQPYSQTTGGSARRNDFDLIPDCSVYYYPEGQGMSETTTGEIVSIPLPDCDDISALTKIEVTVTSWLYTTAGGAKLYSTIHYYDAWMSCEKQCDSLMDTVTISNNARGPATDVKVIASGITDPRTEYYFVTNALFSSGVPLGQVYTNNFTGFDFISLLARDYALSIAAPRLRAEGTLFGTSSPTLLPLFLTMGGVKYTMETWDWDLVKGGINFSALSLPAATITVTSETIVTGDGLYNNPSSSGSSWSGGGASSGGSGYVVPGAVPGLVNMYIGTTEGQQSPTEGQDLTGIGKIYMPNDAIIEVVNIGTEVSPKYALHTNLGFYSDSFVSAGGVGTGGGSGSGSGSGGGGGGGMTPTAMWQLLGASTNEQIDIAHLTTALSGYQPLDADLTAIAGLTGTSGLLKKTSANKWTLDTSTYLTSHQTLYTLTLKVGSATVGTFTPSANATLTITASDLTTAIGNSTYLKLSGGTMTGDIKMTNGKYITDPSGNTIIGHNVSNNNGLIYIGDSQNDTTITLAASGDLVHDTGGDYETIYDSGNLTQSVITTLIGSTTYAPYNSAGYLPLSGGVMSGPISAITYLTVNAAAQTSYRFKVNGTSNLGGNTSITGTLTVGTTTTNKATTLNGTLSVTGASTLTGLLTADGGITVPSGKSITLGSGVLTWDSDNSAWKLTGNFYATGWVSAGGVSSTGGGGGGGGINLEAMWSNLQTNASGTTGYNLQIDYHHLPTIEYSGTGFVKSAAYRKSGDTNYITFTRSGLAASDIPDISSTYVTLATAQTVSANHTFSSGLTLNTASSWTSSDRALYFGANGDDSNIRYYYTDSSKGLTYNPNTGALKAGSFVKRGNSGGFLKADGTEDTTSYLPLAGGTMTGDIVMTNGEYINASNGYAMLGLNSAGTDFYCGPGYTVSSSFLIRSANINLTHRKHTAASTYTDYIIYDASNLTQSVVTGLIGNSTYAPYVSGGYLPLSGGTMTGSITMSNGTTIQGNDSGGTARTLLSLGSGDKVWIAYGAAGAGYDTVLSGNTISLRYGTSHTEGFTLDSSGDVTIANNLILGNHTAHALKGTDTNGNPLTLLYLSSSNNLIAGYQVAQAGYNSSLCGNIVRLYYSSTPTVGFILNASGNSGVGFTDDTYFYRKFNVNGDMLIRGTASGTPGRLVIGNGVHNATGGAGEILFQEYALATETTSGARNGFKIGVVHATSADRVNCHFYTSNNGTSPYAPSWTETMTITYTGRVGIRNTSPTYVLDVTGTIHSTVGIFSDGYVSAGGVSSSSDARLKTDLKNIDLSVDQIADAPAITFKWKNETTSPRHAGSLAQYWEKVMPEVVSEVANHLTLDYGATALLSSITIAKAVKNHEERIKELEEENKQLKAKVYALG